MLRKTVQNGLPGAVGVAVTAYPVVNSAGRQDREAAATNSWIRMETPTSATDLPKSSENAAGTKAFAPIRLHSRTELLKRQFVHF